MKNEEYELEFAHYMEDKEEDAPVEKKGTGLVGRAFLQLIWFAISGGIAYYATQYLIQQSVIDIRDFYRAGVPSAVPEVILLGVVVFLIFLVFQIIFAFGFMIASPKGRVKAGGSQKQEQRRSKKRR